MRLKGMLWQTVGQAYGRTVFGVRGILGCGIWPRTWCAAERLDDGLPKIEFAYHLGDGAVVGTRTRDVFNSLFGEPL